jgi:hypothetical protein
MDTKTVTDTARTTTVIRDDGRHAARVMMLSTLLLFTCIFVLQAIAP